MNSPDDLMAISRRELALMIALAYRQGQSDFMNEMMRAVIMGSPKDSAEYIERQTEGFVKDVIRSLKG